jgi:hypothetical protein
VTDDIGDPSPSKSRLELARFISLGMDNVSLVGKHALLDDESGTEG